MDAPVIAAIVSGVVSLTGILLQYRNQRRSRQADDDTKRLAEENSASGQAIALIRELQEDNATLRKRQAESDTAADSMRRQHRIVLEEMDAMQAEKRQLLERIYELEAEVKQLRRAK